VLKRFARNLAIACLTMAFLALLWAPGRPQLALGVIGGGVLAALALWGLASAVNSIGGGRKNGDFRPKSGGFSLVKFFTRYVILTAVAYVMMVRLHLDAVGMLVGVSSVVAAAAVEAARPFEQFRRRR
jgi:hypothetical protein